MGAGRTVAVADAVTVLGYRGKSGLRRAGCQVIPGGREPTESAAENIPPKSADGWTGKGEKVR